MANKLEAFGKYVLLEKLATGGMAEVFLARGSGAGGIAKFFAVKRILPQFSDSPEFIEMFKDEAKIAINLSHSNIVSIHEFDIKNNQFYLVMDYVEGRNLRQILNKMKKVGMQFSVDQIVYLIKEVAAGLDHAHRCLDGTTGKPLNITHRDMSPQNVMVSFEGEVKIVDFGIAKAESQIETTRAGTLKGKFGYMSPEQAEGQAVDLRTDIFSLGICLWELLANDRLFMANNEINTLRKIRDCQIPSLRKINPNIHSELERIVLKALAKDRNLRYQTCAALQRDLSRFLNRQYPDFAPQDFAVFIKSVFADEILSQRKRLIEFSKLNPEAPRTSSSAQSLTGKTNSQDLLNSQTNSMITAQTSSEINKSLITRSEAATSPSIQDLDVSAVSIPNTKPPTLNIPNSSSELKEPREQKLNAAEEQSANPPTREPVFTAPPSTDNTLEYNVEVDKSSNPSINKNSQPSRFPRSESPAARKSFAPALLTFVVLAFGIYLGSAKFFPEEMSPVIAVADPYLAPVHKVLEIQSVSNISSEAPAPTPATIKPTPSQVAMPPAPTPAEPLAAAPPLPSTPAQTPPVTVAMNVQPPPPAPAAQHPSQVTSMLVVTSNPSGADIAIDGKSTGLITPSRVAVPADRPFSILVKKRGFKEFMKTNLLRESLGIKLDAPLVRSETAYVDIDVVPPVDVKLYMNGELVDDEVLPLRNFRIPAKSDVKFRVEDSNGNSSEEVSVNMRENARRHIQLFLRKRR